MGVKVFISCDMEGVCGTFSWKDFDANKERYRTLMTEELRAAVRGLSGSRVPVKAIVANDAHGFGDNIHADLLPAKVHLVRGSPRGLGMMEGIDRDTDVAFFLGYHGAAGTAASLMDHTYASSSIYRIVVNGIEMSESTINGGIAADFGVPVGLISGDQATITQAKRFFGPKTEYVVTKQGISRFSAQMRPVEQVREELTRKALQAASRVGALKPLRTKRPISVVVDLVDTLRTDLVSCAAQFERTGGRQVSFRARNYVALYRKLRLLLMLAARAKDLHLGLNEVGRFVNRPYRFVGTTHELSCLLIYGRS